MLVTVSRISIILSCLLYESIEPPEPPCGVALAQLVYYSVIMHCDPKPPVGTEGGRAGGRGRGRTQEATTGHYRKIFRGRKIQMPIDAARDSWKKTFVPFAIRHEPEKQR